MPPKSAHQKEVEAIYAAARLEMEEVFTRITSTTGHSLEQVETELDFGYSQAKKTRAPTAWDQHKHETAVEARGRPKQDTKTNSGELQKDASHTYTRLTPEEMVGLADRAVVRRGEEYTRKGTLTGRKQGNQANHYTTEMQKLSARANAGCGMETIIVAVRNDAGANFGAFVGGSLVGARFLNEVLVISGPAFATQFESVSITFTAMEQNRSHFGFWTNATEAAKEISCYLKERLPPLRGTRGRLWTTRSGRTSLKRLGSTSWGGRLV